MRVQPDEGRNACCAIPTIRTLTTYILLQVLLNGHKDTGWSHSASEKEPGAIELNH